MCRGWLIIYSFIISISTYSQLTCPDELNVIDTTLKKKTGFGIGGTPILAYDADLGLKYGVILNLFDYGKVFPKYLQYARIKALNTTMGTSNYSLVYENNKLFKKATFLLEASYTKDISLNFFGYNGLYSVINTDYFTPSSNAYINTLFYTHQRKHTRFRFAFLRELGSSNWSTYTSVMFNKFKIGKTDLMMFNIPNGEVDMMYENTTLYEQYIDWNVIGEDEKNGGSIAHYSLGLIYDTRNNLINSTEGICFETYVLNSPRILDSKGFTKHILTFRHFLKIKSINTLLTYRITSQQKLIGSVPFYYLSTFHDTKLNTEGLGGAFNLRGITKNRIVADGYVVGNLELRKKVCGFTALKQVCKIELSVFSDFAFITQEYDINTSNVPSTDLNNLFNPSSQKMYLTYGGGIYFIYSENNIISLNFGISPNKMLGDKGIYIGSSFLF